MTITEEELEWLQKWAADCIKHNDIDDVPERVLDVLAEVRRQRKFRGDNLVVAEMKVESQQRELVRAKAKTEEQAKEIERLRERQDHWEPDELRSAGLEPC